MLLFKSIVVLDEFNRSKTYETIMQKNGVSIHFKVYVFKYAVDFYFKSLIASMSKIFENATYN